MAIKVTGHYNPAQMAGSQRGHEASKPQQQDHSPDKAQTQTGSAADEGVTLTGAGALLAQAEKALNNVPVVDVQRVDSVRTALHDGTLEMNPERVADKLMQLEAPLQQARAA